jgi:hypothetical protein
MNVVANPIIQAGATGIAVCQTEQTVKYPIIDKYMRHFLDLVYREDGKGYPQEFVGKVRVIAPFIAGRVTAGALAGYVLHGSIRKGASFAAVKAVLEVALKNYDLVRVKNPDARILADVTLIAVSSLILSSAALMNEKSPVAAIACGCVIGSICVLVKRFFEDKIPENSTTKDENVQKTMRMRGHIAVIPEKLHGLLHKHDLLEPAGDVSSYWQYVPALNYSNFKKMALLQGVGVCELLLGNFLALNFDRFLGINHDEDDLCHVFLPKPPGVMHEPAAVDGEAEELPNPIIEESDCAIADVVRAISEENRN